MRLQPPLRFVHASDLHLDRTLEGIAEGPAHWEKRMLNVSQRAAERLFQKVIEENVDFLILSGAVLNANLAAPGTFLFLVEQFGRLKKAGIAVYWAGGEYDSPEDWPMAFPLPDNVYHFPANTIQECYFQRTESASNTSVSHAPVAKIVGMSRNQKRQTVRSTDFPLDPGGLYTIVVANGLVDPESLSERRIDYWALGGASDRQVFRGNPRKKGPDGQSLPLDFPKESPLGPEGAKRGDMRNDIHGRPPQPYTVHYPGATLARSPKDIGQFGATLVEVRLENGPWGEEPVLTPFATSPVRWINDTISLEGNADTGVLADELRERIKQYREMRRTEDLLVNWFVDVPGGPLATSLRRGGLTAELLSELRSLYGNAQNDDEPMVWPVSISFLSPEKLPKSSYEQQTFLGDFLRSVRHFQDNPKEVIDLERYVPKDWADAEMVDRVLLAKKVTAVKPEEKNTETEEAEEYFVTSLEQAVRRNQALQEAALIGMELLGGGNSGEWKVENGE